MGDSNMRIRQMDGLRAVAALAVVMIHVSAGRMNSVGVSCNQTARFAVPLFIMLSGYGHHATRGCSIAVSLRCRRQSGG